jgi:integrase
LVELTRAELRAFHASLEPRGKTAANAVLRLVRTVISFAMKRLDVELSSNPCICVEWFKERNHRPSIAAADLPAFWQAVNRVENPIRQGLWRIAVLSGLHKNDIATMRWEHVHDDRIHVPHPKMKKPFDVAMRRVSFGHIIYKPSPEQKYAMLTDEWLNELFYLVGDKVRWRRERSRAHFANRRSYYMW